MLAQNGIRLLSRFSPHPIALWRLIFLHTLAPEVFHQTVISCLTPSLLSLPGQLWGRSMLHFVCFGRKVRWSYMIDGEFKTLYSFWSHCTWDVLFQPHPLHTTLKSLILSQIYMMSSKFICIDFYETNAFRISITFLLICNLCFTARCGWNF